MDIRDLVRRFIRWRIGNGMHINAWEDFWLPCGPLVRTLTCRVIHASGFATNSTVHDFLVRSCGVWPSEWTARFSHLSACILPSLQLREPDMVQWDDGAGGMTDFSVARAYVSFDGHHEVVPWHRMVWYKGHVPKYSFCLWLACLRRHPTHDRMRSWKHNPPDWKCSLCETCEDSHDHLFFTCPYAYTVWLKVKQEFHWTSFPDRWDLILLAISDTGVPILPYVFRLLLAVSVYMIWRERNRRIFSGEKRPAEQVIRDVIAIVRARLDLKSRSSSLLVPNGG